ncbi:MAG: hypothetical protein V4613_11155 [Bacteroidota bacterium]
MKIKIVLVAFSFILSCGQLAAHHRDSSKHLYTNTIELGGTLVNLFNKDGFRFTSPTTNFYISYTRLLDRKHKWFIKADYHSYGRFNLHQLHSSKKTIGDVVNNRYRTGRISIGKLFVYKQWLLSPYMSVGQKRGSFTVLENDYPYESQFSRLDYKTNGIGIGGSVNYVIKKHWTVGFESHGDYFFENNQLDEYLNTQYKPNQFSLTCHLKAGVLF